MLRIPNPLVSEIKPATFQCWASRQRERGHRLALPRVAPQLRNGTSKLMIRFETASKSRRMNAMCCSAMMNFSTVQFIHLLLQWRAVNFSLSTSSVAVRVSAITSLPFFVPRKMSVSSVCVHTMRCDTMQVLRIVLAKAISNDLLKNLSTEQRSSERISQSNMCRFSLACKRFIRIVRAYKIFRICKKNAKLHNSHESPLNSNESAWIRMYSYELHWIIMDSPIFLTFPTLQFFNFSTCQLSTFQHFQHFQLSTFQPFNFPYRIQNQTPNLRKLKS